MNKTDIEWADMTWNPVTGCLHDCTYCYARSQANRFKGYDPVISDNLAICSAARQKHLNELYGSLQRKTKKGKIVKAAYPFGFAPTFHRYRLDEPQCKKKPQNIFVCSMADLFGNWVPDGWIIEVVEACKAAPQHNYIFLTKNPKRYGEMKGKHIPDGFWYGTTVTCNKDFDVRGSDLYESIGTTRNIFLSIEPLHEPLDKKRLANFKYVKWVIIGAETGNRKDKVTPKLEWIWDIVMAAEREGIPVFMKDSLLPIVGEENMRRDFPEGLRKCET